ncbi:MAG: acyl carrier protein [Desulfobacula sp.]|jgi:acyl carrier protein|uniref:phosphopantetheine-binding protein n=1 Tax=Desulfobacula sp. TaxID=2593537 RepID=UPI001D40EC5D|nr:acyl carrier protein [Desulfobacula sp.]MBT3806055.1 acyl carrier protein [Desulfobacula sp.]MBT4026442.1 acyl carrier protein [Desulfobacula sp.]MBT4200329.1 acyl carrier protein [Desulfobacula sp.]MBT4508474.1 acyl carrier protein [Desulfobacula sp.]
MDKTKEKIRSFMIENFLFGEDIDLKDDTSFLEEGIIDSTGVLELIEYLEEEFNIQIDDEDLIPENLDSLNNLEQFISKLLKTS